MKKTVSPYVHATNWDLCRQMGFNMSEEIDKLMEILIATALDIKNEEGKVIMTNRIRLMKQIELLDNKKDQLAKELIIATKQEKRFKVKLKAIKDNRKYTGLIKRLNAIILAKEYKVREVMRDLEAKKIMNEMREVGPWTKSDLIGHITRLRRLVEGF